MIAKDPIIADRQNEQYWAHLRKSAIAMCLNEGTEIFSFEKSIAWPLIYYFKSSLMNSSSSLRSFLSRESLSKEISLEILRKNGFETDVRIAPSKIEGGDKALNQSLELLEKVWPQAYKEFVSTNVGVCFFSGKETIGFSHPKLFGCPFLSETITPLDPHLFTTYVVHETGHPSLR